MAWTPEYGLPALKHCSKCPRREICAPGPLGYPEIAGRGSASVGKPECSVCRQQVEVWKILKVYSSLKHLPGRGYMLERGGSNCCDPHRPQEQGTPNTPAPRLKGVWSSGRASAPTPLKVYDTDGTSHRSGRHKQLHSNAVMASVQWTDDRGLRLEYPFKKQNERGKLTKGFCCYYGGEKMAARSCFAPKSSNTGLRDYNLHQFYSCYRF